MLCFKKMNIIYLLIGALCVEMHVLRIRNKKILIRIQDIANSDQELSFKTP